MVNDKKQDSGEEKQQQQPGNKDADHRGSSSSSGAKSADINMTPSTSQERPKTITGNSISSSTSKQVRYSFQKKPFVIGVAGGTASGKSTVCSKIMEKLGPLDPKNSNNSSSSTTSTTTSSSSAYLSANQKRVICISQDSFYRKLNEEDRAMVAKGLFNFDHPAAFDVPLLVHTLNEVLSGKMVKVPIYNYMENEISNTEEVIYPADVVLVEGLLLFYFPEVRDMFQMKIFVDTDPDTRLSRRVMRDVTERNRALDVVLSQYTTFVKPSFEEFCLPTKKYADIIVPRGPDNEVAVDLIVTHVQSIFDPSTRHQSIKPYDECLPPVLSSFETTAAMIAEHNHHRRHSSGKTTCLLKKPVTPRNRGVGGNEEPLTVASVVGNGHVPNGDLKSKPIAINGSGSGGGGRVSSPHSPLLRNGFNFGLTSSSAPSHFSNFGGRSGGGGGQQLSNGYSNGHHDHNLIISDYQINSEEEEEDEEIDLMVEVEVEDNVFKGGHSPISPHHSSTASSNSVAVDLIVQTIRDLLANSEASTTGRTGFLSHSISYDNDGGGGGLQQQSSTTQSTPVTPVTDRHRLSPLIISNRPTMAGRNRTNRMAANNNISTLDSDDDDDDDEPQRRIRHSSDSGKDISYNRTIH